MKKLPFISLKNRYKNFNKSKKSCIFKDATHPGNAALSAANKQFRRQNWNRKSVRFIDAFVERISLVAIGFKVQTLKSEGRPSFDTKVFLKIYLYSYLNGLRSSRKLEKECIRNIELQWLLEDIRPNYHSISDFRKDNPSGLKKLFKLFVSFLKNADLIAGETIAIDGTKSRAHNSKKANFNQKNRQTLGLY